MSSWNFTAIMRQVNIIRCTLFQFKQKSVSAMLYRSRQMIAIMRHWGENLVYLWMRRRQASREIDGTSCELNIDWHSEPSLSIRSRSKSCVRVITCCRSSSTLIYDWVSSQRLSYFLITFKSLLNNNLLYYHPISCFELALIHLNYYCPLEMSTVEEVLTKLAKLKEQAAAAPDFLALEKIATKADKIRAKLAEHRSNKQLNGILDKIQLLIQEKSKYFRQAMIKKSNKFIAEDNTRNEEADRTLKYSKSAENLKIMTSKRGEAGRKPDLGPSRSALAANQQNQVMYSTTTKVNQMDQGNSAGSGEEVYSEVPPSSKANLKPFLGSQKNIKKKYEVEDVEKTIANTNSEEKRRLGREINLLEQKLSFSFRQIEDLNKKIATLEDFKEKSSREALQHVSPMAKNYMAKESSIVDEYSQKLREKSFIIEDLKSKVEYFKSMNEELKTKVINEQRRSEDYAEGLKSELKGLRKQIERLKKENQCSKIELEDLEQKNEGLMGQVKKLVAKLQEESKEKENIKRSMSQTSSLKIQEQQKQIESLTSQVQTLSRLEIKLQQEEEEKKKIVELKGKLQQRITELESESRRFEEERNRLELEAYKLEEEKRWLGSELRVNMEAKEMLAEELLATKERLDGQLQAESLKEYENELRARSKLGKLKELKGLISQIK